MGDIHTDTSKASPPPTPIPTPKICGVGGLAIMHNKA
jgi:hypothetical protein